MEIKTFLLLLLNNLAKLKIKKTHSNLNLDESYKITYNQDNLYIEKNDITFMHITPKHSEFLLFIWLLSNYKRKWYKRLFEKHSLKDFNVLKRFKKIIPKDDTKSLKSLEFYIDKFRYNSILEPIDKSIKLKEIKAKVQSNPSKNKLKVEIPNELDSFGTIGDLFVAAEEVKKKKVILQKETQKKKERTAKDILVLWDIENVNFNNDFNTVTSLVPKDAIKYFSYSKRNHQEQIYLKNNLNFILNKLKKRNWIQKRTTKIADDELLEEFHKRKKYIKELYLITSDRDFQSIALEAIDMGIKVTVINNHNNPKAWYYSFNFIKI